MTPPAAVDAARGVDRWVMLFFVALFLLTSGGRMSSHDAYEQLQASTHLVTTGRLGADSPPDGARWLRGRDGRYYELRDIGGTALMLPAAALGAALSRGVPARDLFDDPPVIGRLGVTFTYSLVAALGCLFLFRLFALFHPTRAAFLLTLVFATATIYWPYAKAAWDVLPGAVGVCATLFHAARLLVGPPPGRRGAAAFALGVSAALACAFRASLTPFLFVGVAGTLALAWREKRAGARRVVACLAPILLGVAINAAYNYLRTGSPGRTGATNGYTLVSAMHNPVWHGLWGLFFSPNRGLFVFAPVLLLLFALPFVWRTLPAAARRLFVCFGAGATLYALFVASLSFWGSFGWGPRYLVPVLPIFFFGAGSALAVLWARRPLRAPLAALTALSFALCVAPVLVNWHLACTEYPSAADADARGSHQHAAVWRGLALGLRGEPLPLPARVAADPVRRYSANFPDLWMVRLYEKQGAAPTLTASVALALLAGSAIYAFRRAWGRVPDRSPSVIQDVSGTRNGGEPEPN